MKHVIRYRLDCAICSFTCRDDLPHLYCLFSFTLLLVRIMCVSLLAQTLTYSHTVNGPHFALHTYVCISAVPPLYCAHGERYRWRRCATCKLIVFFNCIGHPRLYVQCPSSVFSGRCARAYHVYLSLLEHKKWTIHLKEVLQTSYRDSLRA